MCGLTGWFSPRPVAPEERGQLQDMVQAIAHRGPDGQGMLIDEHAALGHARLAIIDLDSGAQPMRASGGRCAIVFNGEIYNYRELRRELEADGYPFQTHSDTEVILALYLRLGSEAFGRLRGMFALAIWDGARKRGLLVRDPCGIKPLFYHRRADGGVVFASEAKAIIAAGVRAELDPRALHLLMNFRYLPGDRSLFAGIHQVGPGMLMEWTADGKLQRRQFRYQGPDGDADMLSLLDESVALHLTADVEVACYLSGGIDSAAVSALARRHVPGHLRSFTLAVGDDPREAANAARTAELLDIDNLQGDVATPVRQSLPGLIRHLELPKVNALQVRELAGFAAGEVKVVLSGLGGDELFLGYNAHRILHQADSLSHWLPAPVGRSLAGLLSQANGLLGQPRWSEYQRAMRMLGSLGDWSRVYGYLRNVWDDPGLRQWIYGPRMLDADLDDAFAVLAGAWPEEPDPVLAMARFEWRHKMVNDLLWQEDRCSMAVGLEVRVPFLDPVLAARVQAMSRARLMPGGRPKAYMRSLLRPLLPAEVMQRPKSGFQVDAAAFFSKELRALADIFLSPERIAHYGLFNPAFVAGVRTGGGGKRMRWHYFMLYLMLTTHLWLELFEQGREAPDLSAMSC